LLGCLVSLFGWLFDWLVGWLVVCLVDWYLVFDLVGKLVVCLDAWLFSCFIFGQKGTK